MKKLSFLFLLLSLVCTQLHAQIITTIAGTGTAGFSGDGGPATAAQFYTNLGIALDDSGNIYTGEYRNNCVRKIYTFGTISTIAGRGTFSFYPYGDGGPATTATLDEAYGVATDKTGNVYVTDKARGRIRMVNSAGVISTVVGGTGTYVSGGMATTGGLGSLFDVELDAAGNMYVAGGSICYKVTPAGVITTFVGTGSPGYSGDGGPATAAKIFTANCLATDAAGNVYISDYTTYTVRKVNTAGIISTVAGTNVLGYSGDGGPATVAKLGLVRGIAVDASGNLFICDNNRVRMVNTAGIITTIAGTGVDASTGDGGPATAADLNAYGIAVDCGGNLYLSEGAHNRIRKITYTHAPNYISESNTLLTCRDAGPAPINALLAADDPDIAKTITWSVELAPAHGTVGGAPYSMASTGSTLTPTGITYTPAPGYTGTDSFTIMVGFCSQLADRRTIYVTVNPLPIVAATTGPDTVCTGATVTLSNTTAGGVWSSAATVATVSAGTVTGVAAGTTTISYTVTEAGCSATAAYAMKVIPCPNSITPVQAGKAAMQVAPNPTSGTFTLLLTTPANEPATVTITNTIGTKVQELHTTTNHAQQIKLDVPPGLYFIHVATEGGRYVERVVVE